MQPTHISLRTKFVCILLMMGNVYAKTLNTNDCCTLYQQNFSWFRATNRAEKKWGIPKSVQLAIIKQESDFTAKAKPKRLKLFGFMPWRRPSSAYGYGQVLDQTWKVYLRDTKRWPLFSSRHNISDITDFIGWYAHRASKKLKIPTSDAFKLYLTYHEGIGGFSKKSYAKKAWLIEIAKKVDANAKRYKSQLAKCERELRWKHLYFL